jgi:mevalonate kinase
MYHRKANGKFLLTGEYAVLDGAQALAIPLNRGQWLQVNAQEHTQLVWQAIDHRQHTWFSARFSVPKLDVIQTTDKAVSTRLQKILLAVRTQSPDFLGANQGYQINTTLDFDRTWGLGTSSTLIALVADWADVNPYQLLHESMGGSGYDIACAFSTQAIVYQRFEPNPEYMQRPPYTNPKVQAIDFAQPIDAHYYFVYLNQKQDSRAAIERYRALPDKGNLADEISAVTRAFCAAKDLTDACKLIRAHEQMMGERLQQVPVQEGFFRDFRGAVKSMGAWGGDFVLAATDLEPTEMRDWCNQHSFPVFFSYQQLTLPTWQSGIQASSSK